MTPSHSDGTAGPGPDLARFHEAAAGADLLTPLAGLVTEFRAGRIADPDRSLEDAAIHAHLGPLSGLWEQVFGPFPPCPWKRRTAWWEKHRGERDAFLRGLIASWVPLDDGGRSLIENPATVLGRHARMLARAMPGYEVLGTDVDHRNNRFYRLLSWMLFPGLANYRFLRESVYDADTTRRPAAVAFFGACGSVTDGAMDHAVATGAPFLICRSCCHDNVAANTTIVRRPGFLNRFFALKNRIYRRGLCRGRWPFSEYFSPRFEAPAYPRSAAARTLLDPDTVVSVARHSVDSDVCRAIIDLDRCLWLGEKGYGVLYREELFFAHRAPSRRGVPSASRTRS